MLPPRPFALAVATCAAASLAGPSRAGGPASVQAASELARHAALDAGTASSARASRHARRLLARSVRRLAYSYALTARLLTDRVPAGATAAATFVQAASEVAHATATLATRTDGPLQALAFRALQRTSRLQEDVALELSTARSAGSLEDLIDALSTALRAQDALLSTFDLAVASDRISARRQHAIEARVSRANAARDALRTALTVTQAALHDALPDERSAGDTPARARNGSASDAGRNTTSDLS